MKGFVPTPASVVDLMVDKLFAGRGPTANTRLLDPGCGEGEFIAGVIRWCEARKCDLPHIIGIEAEPARASTAATRFDGKATIEIRNADFLTSSDERFDFIIGNPPYVPITDLSILERTTYRNEYLTAKGRFDLYLLFFEQALRLLKPDGRLVFITPEKFLYVDTARPLREILLRNQIEELHFLDERTFGDLVTYPIISTVVARYSQESTLVISRESGVMSVSFENAGSWIPAILGSEHRTASAVLADACIRISCGVATGADSVYVMRDQDIPEQLRQFAYPTISGRQITEGIELQTRSSILVPYDDTGQLLPEWRLGELRAYLADESRAARLQRRTCAAYKPWYAFHENPPMLDVLRPKLLCKDITAKPFFIPDYDGGIIPRHSVYYIVPRDPSCLDELARHMNSPASIEWLQMHCQRAAKGFLRLQSQVLKRLPIPTALVRAIADGDQLPLVVERAPA
jgi:SAM-dependent methyltransferase